MMEPRDLPALSRGELLALVGERQRQIAELRGMEVQAVGDVTSRNFEALFRGVKS